MSRVARAVVAGQPHHITQRGNRRAAVFHADEERRDYLRLMREYAALHGVAVWAYCLMNNHVHWLLVPRREDALARALRGAHTVYALQYNTRHQTSGHLWQGRFHSCPLDDAHLWAAVRYIERNPVRAGTTLVAKLLLGNATALEAPASFRCPAGRSPLRRRSRQAGAWKASA